MTPSAPPRLAALLLESLLPPTERAAAMIGDLHEEFGLRVARGRSWSRLWYVREAVGVALRYAGQSRRYRRPHPGRLGPMSRITGGEGFVDALVVNVRYAVRRLAKAPLFTVVAIVSLSVGIGANTAMFSLVNAVVIRKQPFEDPGSLVDVYEASEGFSHGTLSYPDYLDLIEASKGVFTAISGSQFALVQADEDDGVRMLTAEAVTGDYFSVLGIRPAMGRLLSEEDHVAPGAHPVVVLGHGYWERSFASDPGVVGAQLRMGGRPYTVIGVAPADFRGSLRGLEPDVFVPIMMYDQLQGNDGNVLENRGNQSLFAKGRLAPGATFAQAEAVAERLTRDLRAEHPQSWQRDKSFALVPTADVIMNPMLDRFIVPAAGMVMAVVGLVLLIACANLASFLLARAADRRKEIAVRLAMGARRRTLVGQLLTETVLLSALGGVAGVLLAGASLRLLVGADLPLPLPITLDLTLDRVVLGFSILVSLAAGLLFGLAPALQSTNPDVAPTLRDETAGGGRSRSAGLRSVLVVGQVAVSVVLLVAAGLFLRSLDASRHIDPGFGYAPSGILQITAAAERYTEEEARAFFARLEEDIAALPGVQAVGLIDNLHLNTLNTETVRLTIPGVPPPPGQDFHTADRARVDPGFLEAAGVRIVAGRGFEPEDAADAERVALVNEELARRFFPAGDAVGATIGIGDAEARVVGVTSLTKVRQLGEDPRPFVYESYAQSFSRFVTVVARTNGDADRLAVDMLARARALDPQIIVIESKTMARHLAIMLVGRQLGALVVSGFALLALLLASIGLYGVVSYGVSRRAREVGIRLSLGADSGSVVRMLTGGGLKLVGLGAGLGLVVSAALARLLSSLLYGVPPLDPATFVGVPLLLAAVALAASWIPARRATRIDPVGSLRSE